MKRAQSLRNVSVLIAAAWVALAPGAATAQGWKPERPIEIIIGCAPGCGPDNMARQIASITPCARGEPAFAGNQADSIAVRMPSPLSE